MRWVASIAAAAAMLPAAAKADCAVKSSEFCGSALAGAQAALAPAEEEPYVVPHFFAIRKNVDDFRYSQSDAEFKKLDRASLSFKQDYEADSASFVVDGVAGYTYGPAPFGRSRLSITPFVSYNQNEVNNPGIDKDQGVYDLGGGAVGDILFPIGRMYQDLQFYPKYIHSFRRRRDAFVECRLLAGAGLGIFRPSGIYRALCPLGANYAATKGSLRQCVRPGQRPDDARV